MNSSTCPGADKSFDVIVIGDLIADLIMPIPQLPVRANQHQLSHDFWLELGGACNFLVAAARLGLRTKALGPVGDDCYGQSVIDLLHQLGINVSDVSKEPGAKTPLTLVLVDDYGEHVFLGIRGNVFPLSPQSAWEEHLYETRALYANGYACDGDAAGDNLLEIFRKAQRMNVFTFFDPGPLASASDPEWLGEMFANTFCLQLTLDEATTLIGSMSPQQAASHLLEQGSKLVAIKMGLEGSLIATREEQVYICAFEIPVRDTTGAGDAFDAACVYGCLAGYTLYQIGCLANAYGAAVCTVLGAGRRIPGREVVANILNEADIDLPTITELGDV